MSLFKTDTVADAYKNKKKEVKAQIKEIKRLADPAERLQHLEALETDLRRNGFYDYKHDNKRRYIFADVVDLNDVMDLGNGGFFGGFAGIVVATLVGTALAATGAGGLIVAAAFGASMALSIAGGIAVAEAFNNDARYLRRELRKDHGTLRNNRRVVDMRAMLDRQVNKNERLVNNATLIKKFSQFAKKCTGKGTAPAPSSSSKGGKYGIMMLP